MPRTLTRTISLPLFALTLGVGACQSERAGMEVVCNAPKECLECGKVDPAHRMMRLAQHIEDNLSNGAVKELFEALAAAAPPDKIPMLEQRAKAVGLASCPLVEAIKQSQADAARSAGTKE